MALTASDINFTPDYRPAVIRSVLCVHPVSAENRGRNKNLGDKCGNKAKIVLCGQAMCLRHAQSFALDVLIKEKLATEIEVSI